MAYMNQEKKKVISEALKKVLPKDWKWSLKVDNYTKITLTIQSAPVDLISENLGVKRHRAVDNCNYSPTNFGINEYYLENEYSGELLEIFQNIKKAMQAANWFDKSDMQTDYFHVAYYYNIQIGKWDKPFLVK